MSKQLINEALDKLMDASRRMWHECEIIERQIVDIKEYLDSVVVLKDVEA